MQKWLNQLRCCLGADSRGPKEPLLDGVDTTSLMERAILGVVWPTEKHWESAALYAAEGIIQSRITA